MNRPPPSPPLPPTGRRRRRLRRPLSMLMRSHRIIDSCRHLVQSGAGDTNTARHTHGWPVQAPVWRRSIPNRCSLEQRSTDPMQWQKDTNWIVRSNGGAQIHVIVLLHHMLILCAAKFDDVMIFGTVMFVFFFNTCRGRGLRISCAGKKDSPLPYLVSRLLGPPITDQKHFCMYACTLEYNTASSDSIHR